MSNERLLYKDEFGYIHTFYEVDGKRVGDKDVKNKLFNYEQEEDDGKLVHLSCKVGDTVYVLSADDKIRTTSIEIISMFESTVIYLFNDGGHCYKNDIGKTVFLTPEEAEKALDE